MKWIDAQAPLDAALAHVGAHREVAVDTEADSLHSYFDKVCLIQISVPGDYLVIDPLQRVDLSKFGAILADPRITKVLHGADYDLRILHRDFGFTAVNLIDTMICSQLLGYEAIGLAALLERHFGFKVDKTHQRADWSQRPLPRNMLDYASTDTRHLLDLAAKLRDELNALGRWDWAIEEFQRLEAIRWTDKDADGEPFRRLKGLGGLDRRSLAIIRALHEYRDRRARDADRPPFKIFSNDAIIETAKLRPETEADLAKVKALAPPHRQRYGRDIVRRVQEALALAEDQLPERGESKAWQRDRVLEGRVNKLRKVRDHIAGELKIDASVLAPRHVLNAIATTGTLEVPAMREWQKAVAGAAFLNALKA